jgi:hypothetical protein
MSHYRINKLLARTVGCLTQLGRAKWKSATVKFTASAHYKHIVRCKRFNNRFI